jgi:chromosome segregation ATPase
VQELRSQLEAEKRSWDELREELDDREETCAELRSELADLKQKSAAARELPEAAELLNQLKSKRKKSKTDLADLEVILEILEN